MNALEFHPWGARSAEPEQADRLVFDLDPHASVTWARIKRAARRLRKHLQSAGLESFLRTSGGKGLHVVVPLNPAAPWEAARHLSKAVAEAMAALEPDEFVSVAGEKNREGRIFIDWLRNARGATSVASYSLRARATAGVAMPLEWTALPRLKSADHYTMDSAPKWLARRKRDPWKDIERIRQKLPEI
jgi:bifunctional non-homologous end joining protein LigD